MWRAAMDHNGLFVSVSSLLITLVFRPLAKNAILMGRSIRSVSHAAVSLLARGDDSCDAPRRHCERCATRQDEDDDGSARLSGSDVEAVMARLGLLGRQRRRGGEREAYEGDGLPPSSCGGCEAMRVVEELSESKVAEEGELREAFGVFDRDGDGFVCAGELWSVLRRLGMAEGARYEDCARMVAARDGDGDGRVSFREFRAMMENAV